MDIGRWEYAGRWRPDPASCRCRHLGLLRNFLAEGDCSAGVVSIVIPGYAERWGYELDKYQVYARFILLDSQTGYGSQYQEYSALLTAL